MNEEIPQYKVFIWIALSGGIFVCTEM